MARGRFLSNSISTSRRFARLHKVAPPDLVEFCQLLYPLLMTHTDDYGRQQGDAFTVKLKVYPSSQRSEEDFERALQALHDVGLITRYRSGESEYLQATKFDEHQQGLHKRTSPRIPGPSVDPPEVPENSGLIEEKGIEEKKDLSVNNGEVRSGVADVEVPASPPAVRDDARRPHPLEEPHPTTTLSAESLQALDAFIAKYPNRSAPRRAVHRVWLELNPSLHLWSRILLDLDQRIARGFGAVEKERRYLPKATTWLRDQHWTTPLPDDMRPPEKSSLTEGMALIGECNVCGASQRGEIRNGAPWYPPCDNCANVARGTIDEERQAR